MGQIILENMEFYSFHGHYPEEQKTGTRFTVSLTIDTDLIKPSITDDLNDAIDYSKVYVIVREEMMIPSKLLEHVAGRIINALYKYFKGIDRITVKVTKLNPPLGGQTAGVSIVMTK